MYTVYSVYLNSLHKNIFRTVRSQPQTYFGSIMNIFICLVLSALFPLLALSSEETSLASPTETTVLHVCEAGDKSFVGVYASSNDQYDGVATFSNGNDKSFFRNNGFW